MFSEEQQEGPSQLRLESSLRLNNTHLDIGISDPSEGKATTFFVPNTVVGPHNELILSSGYVKANPQGQGLGSQLFEGLSRVLEALAEESGRVLVHPLYPSSERSRKFFARKGYVPDFEGQWMPPNPKGPWFVRIYQPGIKMQLGSSEQELYDKFKVIYPELAE